MAIDAAPRQLRNGWINNRRAAEQLSGNSNQSVSLMLKFYSVECGLKSALADRQNLRSIAHEQNYITHDLRILLKDLHISAAHADALDNRRAIDAFGGQIALKSVHEAWRYGRTIHASDNQEAGAALDALHDWCKEEL